MNLKELNEVLEIYPQIEWLQDEEGTLYFRHTQFDKDNEALKVTPEAFNKISAQELIKAIIDGRNVDGISRVTGYYSRISGWNLGKRGEAKERFKTGDIFGK